MDNKIHAWKHQPDHNYPIIPMISSYFQVMFETTNQIYCFSLKIIAGWWFQTEYYGKENMFEITNQPIAVAEMIPAPQLLRLRRRLRGHRCRRRRCRRRRRRCGLGLRQPQLGTETSGRRTVMGRKCPVFTEVNHLEMGDWWRLGMQENILRVRHERCLIFSETGGWLKHQNWRFNHRKNNIITYNHI